MQVDLRRGFGEIIPEGRAEPALQLLLLPAINEPLRFLPNELETKLRTGKGDGRKNKIHPICHPLNLIDHLLENQIHPKDKRLCLHPECGIIINPKPIYQLNRDPKYGISRLQNYSIRVLYHLDDARNLRRFSFSSSSLFDSCSNFDA